MNKLRNNGKLIAITLVIIISSSCVSTTKIQSNPNNAKIYINGEYKGITPYDYSDTKIVGSTTSIKLERQGYETFNGSLCRNEQADAGPIIAGIFFGIWPFLWSMKYYPTHTYELKTDRANDNIELSDIKDNPNKADNNTSRTEIYLQIRELKKLQTEEIITNEEFNSEKGKLLNKDSIAKALSNEQYSQLRLLKGLLNDSLITISEFNNEKYKIFNKGNLSIPTISKKTENSINKKPSNESKVDYKIGDIVIFDNQGLEVEGKISAIINGYAIINYQADNKEKTTDRPLSRIKIKK